MMSRAWAHFWSTVWWWSETLHIPLGRFVPWVFGQAIGAKYRKEANNE